MAHRIDPRAKAVRRLADRESFALLKAIPCSFGCVHLSLMLLTAKANLFSGYGGIK